MRFYILSPAKKEQNEKRKNSSKSDNNNYMESLDQIDSIND